MEYESPSINKRIMSSTIDGLLIMIAFTIISSLFRQSDDLSVIIRISTFVVFLLLYEPIMTSKYCTLGQLITGIRVIDYENAGKISLVSSFLRFLVKLVLGIISFIVISFSKDRRALHDFVAHSVVVTINKT